MTKKTAGLLPAIIIIAGLCFWGCATSSPKHNGDNVVYPDNSLTPVGSGEYRNERDGSILVEIPAGQFIMGSNESDYEKPVHTVYLDKYCIGKYEVTVGQFN